MVSKEDQLGLQKILHRKTHDPFKGSFPSKPQAGAARELLQIQSKN